MENKVEFCANPDGARIAYLNLGNGPALVWPPGYWQVITPYVPEARQLRERIARYHRVVQYDSRGAGLSDRNRTVFTLESEIQDLETVIDHLKLDRIILLGLAAAGPIAIAYAAKHPERVTHLILYGTFANRRDVSEEFITAIVSLMHQPDNLAGRKLLTSLIASRVQIDAIEWMVTAIRDISTPEVAAKLIDMDFRLDVTNLCPSVKAPTLVMHRKGDQLFDFKQGLELASLIPNARFVPLEGNTHFVFFGDTESILHNIFEFLGDPVPEKSSNDAGKESLLNNLVGHKADRKIVQLDSLSHLDEPISGQNKGHWLRLSNPLVYFTVILLASVAAGIILMLIKC